jgi:bacterioferritin (cytochrome b1)
MSAPATGSFLETIETIRKRARKHMEKGAVTEGYQAPMIRFLADRDSSTRVMLEKILAAEEEHADDLANLLVTLDPTKEGS